MSLTIELEPELENRVRKLAEANGMDAETFVQNLVSRETPGGSNTSRGKISTSRLTALASEKTLSKIWDTPEEDEAWQDL